ncbi:hypothetical protein Lfu02_00590 [Longispora fulva]|uniref:Uncharacterized protein n=1 Tax=Longispora fulva TaxID=619741 RepID=A0A8J7GDU2_9ACTN|nr:hypothetical protein [Longispora fulva]MBG6136070.1 hypothetical protein [Longispora fulva]GIG55687.1 hypothetical protein Lfu02_00590 [Longispora fulva]
MTYYVFGDEHVGQVTPAGPDEAATFVSEQEHLLQAHGGRAVAHFFGPDGGAHVLRLDVDWDAERAAVRERRSSAVRTTTQQLGSSPGQPEVGQRR